MEKLKALTLSILLLPCVAFASILKSAGNLVNSTERALAQHVEYPFYFGVGGGYGNTDWDELVTDPDDSAAFSAPIAAKSGGFAYKGFVGYQFTRHFAVELDYTRYPTANLDFKLNDDGTAFSVYGIKSLQTDTSTFDFLGKLLVPFAFTQIYVYVDAGLALTYKHDKKYITTGIPGDDPSYTLENTVKAGPSFGFGVMYNVTQRIVTEFGFQYSTGFDRADDTPVEDYVPFTYDLLLSAGVRL